MKYLILVFVACTLVCATYAAAIKKAVVQQGDDEDSDGDQSLLSFLEAQLQDKDDNDKKCRSSR